MKYRNYVRVENLMGIGASLACWLGNIIADNDFYLRKNYLVDATVPNTIDIMGTLSFIPTFIDRQFSKLFKHNVSSHLFKSTDGPLIQLFTAYELGIQAVGITCDIVKR